MANVLKREKRIEVLHHLAEGNSIRGTERLTGVYRNTIMRLLVSFGESCRQFLDKSIWNVSVEHVECDEIWTYVFKKQKRLRGEERDDPTLGDIYLFTAIDMHTKLLITYAIGKRNSEVTDAFVADLSRRIVRPPQMTPDSPQISTDGFAPYYAAIRSAFGHTAKHGVLMKSYVNPEVGRYAPPELQQARRFNIRGIDDVATICTSHVERNNLTIRTFLKRFTRLALGFSKRLDNLAAAVALHVANYNFCWRPREKGRSGKLRPTPAMMSRLVDRLWDFEELYDAVMELEAQRKRRLRYDRLMAKLRSAE